MVALGVGLACAWMPTPAWAVAQGGAGAGTDSGNAAQGGSGAGTAKGAEAQGGSGIGSGAQDAATAEGGTGVGIGRDERALGSTGVGEDGVGAAGSGKGIGTNSNSAKGSRARRPGGVGAGPMGTSNEMEEAVGTAEGGRAPTSIAEQLAGSAGVGADSDRGNVFTRNWYYFVLAVLFVGGGIVGLRRLRS